LRRDSHPFFGRLYCAECGALYLRRTITDAKGKKKVWNCKTRQHEGPQQCEAPFVPEESLEAAIARAVAPQAQARTVRSHISGSVYRVQGSLASQYDPADIEKRIQRIEVLGTSTGEVEVRVYFTNGQCSIELVR